MILCEKCGKTAFSVIQVERANKYGKTYRYKRFVHYDRRKHSKRRYCYLPIVV